jgi:competence protein ComEC
VSGLARLALALCAAPGAAHSAEPRELRIAWIDVEGGAATLVVAPTGETLLMDAGWPGPRDAERIAAAVRAEGADRIDHLLISHFHTDHWGGVEELARRIPIGRFHDRGLPGESDPGVDRSIKPELRAAYLRATGGRQERLRAGDVLELGAVRVEVVCANGLVSGEPAGAGETGACTAEPAHLARPDDGTDNALSLGILVRLGAFEFLDLGDLTWNVEHKLVCPEDRIGPLDVFQASHHGHEQSNNAALLAAARPAVVVVANGARKGASASTLADLRAIPGLEGLFQLHRNVTLEAALGAAPELVANDEEDCKGAGIRLVLDPAGKSYSLEVPSKGTRKTYAVRAR